MTHSPQLKKSLTDVMNPYKRMCVIPEEEYNRLKLCTTTQHQVKHIPDVISTQPHNENNSHIADEQPDVHQSFNCQICAKEYSNKHDIRRHIQIYHSQSTLTPIESITRQKKSNYRETSITYY